jgi:hypothetical protein
MRSKTHVLTALIALALTATACGVPAVPVAQDEAAKPETTTTSVEVEKTTRAKVGPKKTKGFECPVTIPPQPGLVATEPKDVTYSKNFPAPDPWPSEYPAEGMVWYGSDELWTALAIDGDHGGRKSAWWSVSFPGGMVEEQPEVYVTWTRLDTVDPVAIDNDGMATNAYIPSEGWFMIAGIDPDQAGCWEVEASYKGATLSYVYEKTE